MLAEFMYPHIAQAAEVCAEEAERFLIEGSELSPSYPARLRAALEGTELQACFLGGDGFSVADLDAYRGPKPQHHGASPSRGELREAAAWIRRRSRELRQECADAGVSYVDVGEVGFEALVATGLAFRFAIAGTMRTPEAANALSMVTGLPLGFLIGATYPWQALPGDLPHLTGYLPFSSLIETVRGIAVGQAPITHYGHQVLIGVGWLVAALVLAVRLYRLTEE